jgi:HAD superfamily hydrolase (TIGR01549 family)
MKTFVFDVSGVLIDDLFTVWKTNNDAYSIFGYNIFSSIEEFKERFKLPIVEFHRSNGIPEEMINKVERMYIEQYPLYQHLIRVFPEVKRALSELRNKGIKLAISSNIPNKFLREHLERFELSIYFDAITGQDDCDEQKPSPKPILITLLKMNESPKKASYIGDMEEDIIAGKKVEYVL